MYKQIKDVVGRCGACRELENAQTKCPMVAVEIPSQPWHTVGADLFHQKGRWFLLVTDVYSKAPFVRPLPNTGAYATVIAMKNIFSENGIPMKVISDNGKHFVAREFKDFASKWGFEMVLSSPEYPQGHALIERHIQTIKKCMEKCDSSGYDVNLALLALRSTPLTAELPSPAELLQSRRFRTTVPTYVPDPSNSEFVKDKLLKRQAAAADHYDQTAKEKVPLVCGQPVRLYNKVTRRWEPAVVTGEAGTPRSYMVKRLAGGVPLRRNRVHLRTTLEDFQASHLLPDIPECEDESETVLDQSNDSASDESRLEGETMNQGNQGSTRDPPVVPRRSTRVGKEPDRYGFSKS